MFLKSEVFVIGEFARARFHCSWFLCIELRDKGGDEEEGEIVKEQKKSSEPRDPIASILIDFLSILAIWSRMNAWKNGPMDG